MKKMTLSEKVTQLPEVGYMTIETARYLDKLQQELEIKKKDFIEHLNRYWSPNELKAVKIPVKNNQYEH